jgi:hypothetical protein
MTLKEKSLGAQLRRWRQLRCLLGLSTWGVAVVVMVVVLRQRQSLGMLPGKRQWLTWMLGCLVCGTRALGLSASCGACTMWCAFLIAKAWCLL